MQNEILTPSALPADNETSIRPSWLQEFVGQDAIKDNMSVFLKAAIARNESLDHTLFYGPPGLGKTSLAQIVAKEMGVNFKPTSGPLLTKAADLAAILTNLSAKDVLFIDEIHRMSASVEEMLYSAMEDFVLDIMIGEGPAARSVRIDLPKFTLVGATTRLGLLSNPLRDRFGIPIRLSFYSHKELSEIIKRAAHLMKHDISEDGTAEIARRSRGTPRIALRLLKRVSDFAIVDNDKVINSSTASNALDRLEVDKMGLDSNDYRYLNFIFENYEGGPVGIETIAAGLSEQKDSIEETIEPYLIQTGMLQRTSRGRVLTQNAVSYLKQ